MCYFENKLTPVCMVWGDLVVRVKLIFWVQVDVEHSLCVISEFSTNYIKWTLDIVKLQLYLRMEYVKPNKLTQHKIFHSLVCLLFWIYSN